VWTQLAGTSLLLLLFYLLVRHAGARPYFARWMLAWLALLSAVLLVIVRYYVAPLLTDPAGPLLPPAIVLTHTLYQFAKLLYLGLMLQGCWQFVHGAPPRLHMAILLPFLGVLAFATAFIGGLDRAMALQAIAAVPAFAGCVLLLGGLPEPRRTMGTRLTAAAFGLLGLLWLGYGVTFSIAVWAPRLVGHWLSLLPRYNSFFDTGASVLLAYGMVVILLEDARREAEAARAERLRAVAESEARLKAVIETATDAIIALDGEGRVLLFNAGASRIFGIGNRDAVGRPLVEVLPGPARPELARRLAAARGAAPGRQAMFEVTIPGNGGEIPLEIAASTLALEDGYLDILVLRDLSERRRAEQEREQLRERLAESARMESLGRLVSGVAHELNNPLAAILTFSEQLLAEHPTTAAAGPLGTIHAQARRARVVVRDLLSFVRRREERREATDLPALVDRTVRAFAGDLETRGVRLVLSVEPGLPLLTCDPQGIEQVVTNLLDNAVRAAGGGEVTLGVRRQANGIAVTVEDSGPGIPVDVLPRLFEPFFTTRGTGEGTGLGLSVSLGIVQQHGGTLTAENRAGGPGARFTAWLPLGLMPSAETAVRPLDRGALAPGGRVLIIDDESAVRASIRRYFERQHWVVEEAGDGAAALARLVPGTDAAAPDLIICDLRMPGVSGIEVHRWVSTTRPELLGRLVFASGDTASQETAAFLASTGCPVLEKPFELSELAAVALRISRARNT